MQLNAQGSKAIPQFLDGCDPAPPPPPPPQGPRGYSQSIVSSSFSVSFTPRIIESKSSRVINLNHLWSELVVTRWTYSISVDRKLLKIGTPEKHDQSHDPWSKEIHRGQRIKERNKTVDKTDKEKKKEIKIIENKAFLPLFHCPFVKLFSLVIITSNHRIMKFQPEINANNVILSALASTLL